MLVILTVASYLQLWRRNKKQSFNIRETLYTSYKNAYAMTQEIKIILTLKRKNMIPNIKSSEGIETVSWKKYTWAQSLSCSACFRKPSTYTLQIISQRNCIQLPRFCHWEKQLQKNYKRRVAGPDLYTLRRNRVFWVRL
jgi:hypothetical protein